jgi:non-heme chloroperoxidase
MSGRTFDHFLCPLVQDYGFRCVTYDRRGFGDSRTEWRCAQSDPKRPNTLDLLADDAAQVIRAAVPNGSWIGIGASMGAGELVRALERHSDLQARCEGLVFLGANLPKPMWSETNPLAPKREVSEAILQGVRKDRVTFVKEALGGVFGEHVGVELSLGQRARLESIIGEADAVAIEQCTWIIAGMDLTEELKRLGGSGLKVLILHGDADQSLSVEAGVGKIPSMMPQAKLKVYEKAAHGKPPNSHQASWTLTRFRAVVVA